jgi:hypothetical protein
VRKIPPVLLFLLLKICAFAQGRVVINEYLPWTAEGCPEQSEYVELYNFGPGPVNIGCYILSEGEYSITIPPNTIINPGQYFVISGVDVISSTCSNTGGEIKVDLNWNTCKCMSSTNITGNNGLFTDGGGAREQVVLMDPQLKIIDAIVRELPKNKSVQITTSDVSGSCTSKTFILDPNIIPFETIGSSTGRANSYVRKYDGDCEWVKDADQSPGTANSRGGSASSIDYSLTVTSSMECEDKAGAIGVSIQSSSIANIFPVNYYLAFDSNGDKQFTLEDQYVAGIGNSPPVVEIGGLKEGLYKITLSSAAGCSLETIPFSIQPCQSALPLQVLFFKHLKTQQNRHRFEWSISEVESMLTLNLEQSIDNNTFTTATKVRVDQNSHGTQNYTTVIPASESRYFRLRITQKNGATVFSPTIKINESVSVPLSRLWPNPAKGIINIETGVVLPPSVSYKIYNLQGSLVDHGTVQNSEYQYGFTVPVYRLPRGLYQLFVYSDSSNKPISFRFVKE